MPQAIPAVIAAISYVGTATAAVVAGTATLAQIATVAAVGIGAGVGGMAAAKALTPQIGSQGAAVQWIADPDEPLRFAFGRVGVKGSIKDAAVYGPDRMYVSFACTVSAAGPIKSFVNFRAGDYYMSFDGAGKALNEPYRDEMWFATRLGAQPDTALPLPSGLKSGASFPGWNSTRRFSGSAAYMVTLGENSKRSAYGGKIPAFVATIEGLYCYDPRLDSTYPGGSGACRLNNPATWVWTQNPILFALKWALGLWEGPTGKGAPQVDYQVGGIGAKVESILLHTAVEAANVAQANGWISAAWPSTDDDKAQVLDGFLKAGGAMYAEIAGKMAFIHRAAPRAPVFTVTARDTAGPVEIDTASSKLNRINTLRPRYWSEAHEWEMTALPEVTSTVWQEEDGQGVAVKRTRGADFSFVPQAKQARELASLEISHSREGIRGRVPLRPYMDPEPGNCFIFDEPDFALSNLKCFVLNVDDDTDDDTIVVTFETETDGKYPFAYGQTGNPPPAQELDPVDPTFVSPPLAGEWTVTVREPSEGGSQVAVFDVAGSVGNATATGLLIWLSETGADPWQLAWSGPPTATSVPVSGMQPGVSYYVGISYQRGQNESARLILGPYDTPEIVALSPDESEALERLARIESDNWLSKGEKPEVIEKWNTVFNERTGIENALTAAGLTSTKTAYSNAAQALSNYLTGLFPAWNNLAEDTPITGSALRNAFMAYYVAKQQANQALSAAAAGDASAALTRLTAIESDGVLSKGEKGEVIRQVTTLNDEYAALAARGNAAGATAAVTTYSNALTALNSYLTGLSPAWNNVAVDTPITGGTFRSNFNTVYVARQAVMNAILGIVGADAANALAAIAIIGSDAWLSKGEKSEVIRQRATLLNDYPGLEAQAALLGVTTQLTAHATAINAMRDYLDGLSPAWNNTAEDTPINGTTLRTRFNDAYTTRQTLLNAITTALNAQVGTAAADAVAALNRITAMTSDSVLSRDEKPGLVRSWQVIVAEFPGYSDQALAIGATAARAALITAYADLSSYLAGLSPAYDNLSQDTPIVPATFAARFQAYYVARAAVSNAMIGLVQDDANAALERLTVIASDNWLSTNEKASVIQDYAAITGEYADLQSRGAALGVGAPLTAYNNALTALNTYLVGLSPAWNNLTADTVIVGATFRQRWADYYAARSGLMTALAAAAGGNAQAALDALARIASDNWLTANEKPEVVRQRNTLVNDYPGLEVQATALGLTTALSAHAAAINAMRDYLDGLSPAYNSLTTDTVIDGATLRTRFTNAYTTKQTLQNAITAAIGADAAAALTRLDVIVADGWLSRNEKPRVIQDYAVLLGEYLDLIGKGNAAGATAAVTAYQTAISNLNSYMFSLSPAYDNLSVDTAIVGTTFRARWTDYYAKKTALQTAISTASGGAAAVGFIVGGTPSPVLSAFNSPTASASVSLSGPAPVGDVIYKWEQTGGTPATMTGASTSLMTANIGTTTGGVSQFRVWVSDDERTKSRDIRIRFRSTV